MKEGIKALVGSEQGRHAQGKQGIDNTQNRESAFIAHPYLLVGLLFGYNQPGVRFGPRPSGGRNGNDGQGPIGYRLASPTTPIYIIPEVSFIGSHDRYTFCRVNGASTSQPNNKITVLLFAKKGAFHNMVLDGVGQYLIKKHRAHPSLDKLGFQLCKVPIVSGRSPP